jgi:FKBP-type peptidyl-prolyl cis-trans isomerase FkpA
MRVSFFFVLALVGLALSCDKDDDLTAQEKYNKQLGIDTVLIDNYLVEHGLTALTDTSGYGLRYVIHEEGDGRSPKYNKYPTPGDCFNTSYKGLLLTGDVPFDSASSYKTSLSGGNIVGWDIGFPYLQEGDSATLYLPSGLAYGTKGSTSGSIPANAIIYFHVRLFRVVTPEYNPANGVHECYYDDFSIE